MIWLQKICDTFCNLKTYPRPTAPPTPPLVVAHRGAWGRGPFDEGRMDHTARDHGAGSTVILENTLEAFTRARDLGIWAIELDVHFTKDNVPVVHHDPTLLRVLKRPLVIRDHTWAELEKLSPDLARLDTVLRLTDLHFMIEVKTPLLENQIEILLQTLAPLTPVRDYHFLTLDPDFVFTPPRLPSSAWILVGEFNLKELVPLCLEKRYGGVAGHYLLMKKDYVTQLHSAGLKVGTGQVPNKNLYNREWSRGIDWVFTNHASRLAPTGTQLSSTLEQRLNPSADHPS